MSYKIVNLEGLFYSLPSEENFINNQNYETIEINNLSELGKCKKLNQSVKSPKLKEFLKKYFLELFKEHEYISIYDVGGYMGLFGLSFADYHRQLGFSSKISVNIFEPTPLYSYIKESIKLNQLVNSVKVHRAAISSEISTKGYFAKNNSLISGRLYNFPGSTKLYDVEVEKLDSYSMENKGLNIVKIDTEGHELHVFEGAKKLLSNPNTVIFLEYWPWLEKTENSFGMKYSEFLLKNYHVIDINSVSHPTFSMTSFLKNKELFQDLISRLNNNNRGTTDLLCISKKIADKYLLNLLYSERIALLK